VIQGTVIGESLRAGTKLENLNLFEEMQRAARCRRL
jgi:hypothetical protein